MGAGSASYGNGILRGELAEVGVRVGVERECLAWQPVPDYAAGLPWVRSLFLFEKCHGVGFRLGRRRRVEHVVVLCSEAKVAKGRGAQSPRMLHEASNDGCGCPVRQSRGSCGA